MSRGCENEGPDRAVLGAVDPVVADQVIAHLHPVAELVRVDVETEMGEGPNPGLSENRIASARPALLGHEDLVLADELDPPLIVIVELGARRDHHDLVTPLERALEETGGLHLRSVGQLALHRPTGNGGLDLTGSEQNDFSNLHDISFLQGWLSNNIKKTCFVNMFFMLLR